jgi:hypothetical protein
MLSILMTSVPTGSELAVLALVCVLTIFFFPAMHGPYSAVHGPVTALQAARAAIRLRIAIALCVRGLSANLIPSPLVVLPWTGIAVAEFRPFSLAECDSILRC